MRKTYTYLKQRTKIFYDFCALFSKKMVDKYQEERTLPKERKVKIYSPKRAERERYEKN